MVQIAEQTKEEKITMYMKLSKKELIEMIIENENLIKNIQDIKAYYYNNIKCDSCGRHPNSIIVTGLGTFCQECAKYISYS